MLAGSYKDAPARQQTLRQPASAPPFHDLLGQENLMRFFIQSEVTRLGHTTGARVGFAFLAGQQWGDATG